MWLSTWRKGNIGIIMTKLHTFEKDVLLRYPNNENSKMFRDNFNNLLRI